MFTVKNMTMLAAAVLITGCGGGSGVNNVQGTTSTIQGDAVKGPMVKAKISLYRATADGKQGDLLQETTSDDNGHYSVTLNDYNGVVVVVASVVPGTTMYDEATGQTISPAAGFRLRASFSVESGKTYSTQINPFTDLATAKALIQSGGLTATNVEKANHDMAVALTFNPLTTVPTFDTNKKPTNNAAGALAAVSQMALSGSLACSTGSQAAKVACVTTALSEKGLADAGVKAALQATLNLVNDNSGLPTLTITDPSGTPPPTATPLEQAKAFMGALRSNAKALNASDLSLQTELKNVADDMQGRTAPLVNGNITTLNVARLGAQLWNDVIKGDAPFITGQNFYKGYESLGSCGFYSDTDYKVRATSKTDAKYVACGAATESIPATNANGGYQWCSAVDEWCDTQWSYRVRLHPDATDPNKFTIYTQTRESKRTLATVGSAAQPPTYTVNNKEHGAAFPGNAATLVTQKDSNGQITALNLTGELSPGFSVAGPSYPSWMMGVNSQTYYLPGAVVTVLGDKHNVVLSAALTKVGDLDKLALSGSVELIKAGALESRIELAAGSYLQARLDAAGGYSAQDGSQEMLLKLKGGTTGSTVAGDLKMSAFKADASGTSYIPTLVAFNGSVQRNGVTFFEGSLKGEALNHATFNSNLPRSTTNVQTLRAGFVGKVSIPNRPVLNVSLSATTTNKGSSASSTATFSGQYVQGLLTINMSGTSSAFSDIITLESPSGIKLVIDKSMTTYPLTESGQPVGEYSASSNRIIYTDNSYEQF